MSSQLLLALEWTSFGKGLLVVLFLLVSLILILTVLIQRPQGGGLSGAFGSSASSGQTAFGARTGDALTVATIIMFIVWLVVALGLNYLLVPADVAAAAGATGTQEQTPADTTTAPSGDPAAAPPATDETTPDEAPAPPPDDVVSTPEDAPGGEPPPEEPSEPSPNP